MTIVLVWIASSTPVIRITSLARCFIRRAASWPGTAGARGQLGALAGRRRSALCANQCGVESRRQVPGVCARRGHRSVSTGTAKASEYANSPDETQIQYDLYRIPFNGGKGGEAERIEGASQNGKSNSFPKVSPDGKWIVFVQAHKGLLMRPDSQLFIVPAGGGTARRLRANMWRMNSWHSFSPNGRWLVFSSKARSPYTQMYLTHIDEDGNDSPAILIEDATAANRAVNIPEFVNIAPHGMAKIDTPATEFYRLFDDASELGDKKQYDAAIAKWNEALALSPDDAKAHSNLGVLLARVGRI